MATLKPFYIALVFEVGSFILCMISFGTGYWYVSPDEESLFHSIGLWQACFNGYEHTSDLIGKAYYGCWWLFYKEYYYIRSWLLPSWFVAVQTFATFGVVFQFLSIALLPLAGRPSNNLIITSAACFTEWMAAICQIIVVVIFGVMIGEDRTWVPGWERNVLGWSYGLAVVTGFFSIFSAISLSIYLAIRKYEQAVGNEKKPQRTPRI